MKKLFCLIIVGLLILSITGCECENKQTDFAYYDPKTEEFYILDIPISKGAGYFINEILKDSSWVLTTVEIPDGWSSDLYLSNYTIPHYVTFDKKGNTVEDSTLPNYLFIEWYQSGQLEQISINYDGCHGWEEDCDYYLKRRHTWDSIFPDKKIANRRCGYFEFFGIKNIKVYCCPGHEEYKFGEVTNEKYEVDIRDVENRLKELTPGFDTVDGIEDEIIEFIEE